MESTTEDMNVAIRRLTIVLSMVVMEAILIVGIAAGGTGTSSSLAQGPQAGSPIPSSSRDAR
jgi:hypothetical protein